MDGPLPWFVLLHKLEVFPFLVEDFSIQLEQAYDLQRICKIIQKMENKISKFCWLFQYTLAFLLYVCCVLCCVVVNFFSKNLHSCPFIIKNVCNQYLFTKIVWSYIFHKIYSEECVYVSRNLLYHFSLRNIFYIFALFSMRELHN